MRAWKCQFCRIRIQFDAWLIQEHLQLHRADNPITSVPCANFFTNEKPIQEQEHLQTQICEQPTNLCEVCGHSFISEGELTEHVCNTEEKTPICFLCGKAFARSQSLDDHIRSHIGEKPFICGRCHTSFSSQIELKAHKLSPCSCAKSSSSGIDKNQQDQNEPDNKRLPWRVKRPQAIKKRKYPTRNQAPFKHVSRNSQGVQVNITLKLSSDINQANCRIKWDQHDQNCRPPLLSDPSRGELGNQMVEDDASCPTNKTVTTTSQQGNQSKLHHSKIEKKRPRRSLRNQSKRVSSPSQIIEPHASVKKFDCFLCARKFSRMDHLYAHIRQHIGENPFSCEQCDKTFAQRNKWRKHERICYKTKPKLSRNELPVISQISSNEGKIRRIDASCFDCIMCDKKFTRKATLFRHLQTHTCEKPNNCSNCDEAFLCPKVCRTHERACYEFEVIKSLCNSRENGSRSTRKKSWGINNEDTTELRLSQYKSGKKISSGLPKLSIEYNNDDVSQETTGDQMNYCMKQVEQNTDNKKSNGVRMVFRFPCVFCKKIFTKPTSLERHSRKVHKDSNL